MKKRILLLGASGSIGKQTIDIVKYHNDKLEIVGISVYNNQEFLYDFLKDFTPKYVYVKKKDNDIVSKYPNIKFYDGFDGLSEIVKEQDYDLLVNALVGSVGVLPTINAIKNHKDIALANKETLVMAGDLINELLKEYNVKIFPIDSEHSAIFQVLNKDNVRNIKRLILTASGGAFRDYSKKELEKVSLQDALNHPNWSMGKKVTIDSATLMNKANEVIEAHHLFNVPYDKIDVVIQRESIIHSMVEFEDGSVLAQMSNPDMRLPIQYALLYPKHLSLNSYSKLDFDKIKTLNFMKVDFDRYSLFKLVKDKALLGGEIGAIITGANDTLVELFIDGKIGFTDIERGMKYILNNVSVSKKPSLDDLIYAKNNAAKKIKEYFNI